MDTIQRLHDRCVTEPKHSCSKSCKLYREAVHNFNRNMDHAIKIDIAENIEEKQKND